MHALLSLTSYAIVQRIILYPRYQHLKGGNERVVYIYYQSNRLSEPCYNVVLGAQSYWYLSSTMYSRNALGSRNLARYYF